MGRKRSRRLMLQRQWMKTSSARQHVRRDDPLSQAAYASSDRVTPTITVEGIQKIVDETQKAIYGAKARYYSLWMDEPDNAFQAQQQATMQQILNAYTLSPMVEMTSNMVGMTKYGGGSPPQEEGKTEVEQLASTVIKALRPQRR